MSAGATTVPVVEAVGAREEGRTLAQRIVRRVAVAHVIANLMGAIDVFLLLWLVLPKPDIGAASQATVYGVNALAFAIFVPITFVVGTLWGYYFARPLRRFLLEGRPPTEEERIGVLRHPWRCAQVGATLWLAASILGALINARFSGDVAFHVGSTILMGGLTTTALTYLLTERLMRPLTAIALAAGSPPKLCGPGVQGRLLLAWVFATGVPLLGIAFVGLHASIEGSTERVATSALVLSAAATAVGLGATVLVARSVGEPLLALRRALGRIEQGELDVEVAVDDGSEVGLLQSGFNRMAVGLQERERLQDLFGRHVGAEVARDALERPPELGGEQREVAVLFVDLVGSTELAARRPAEVVVSMLNSFFTVVVDTVGGYGGWVNKFEGDAALCVFGAPFPDTNCASSALAAARALRARLENELPEADAGIAVSAGGAVAGNVGSEHRFEYTVIGDPVNEAARLCELAKRLDGRVLASEAVLQRAGETEGELWRLDEEVVLRGRTEPIRLAMLAGAPAATAAS
jgi:adenylate cyclase